MIYEILLLLVFTFLGIMLGTLTGLIPGLHVNNVALIMIAASPAIFASLLFLTDHGVEYSFIPILVAAVILATSITHTFLDFIPSTFLGAPEGETALAVLPAHAMVLEGKGYQAVYLSALGSLGAMVFAFIMIVPFRFIIGPPINGYDYLKEVMVFVLIGIVVLLIFTETKKVSYRKVFVGAGVPNEREDDLGGNGGRKSCVPEILMKDLTYGEKVMITGEVVRCDGGISLDIKDGSGTAHVLIIERNNDIKKGESMTFEGVLEKREGTYSRTLGLCQAALFFLMCGAFGWLMIDVHVSSPVGLPATVLFPALSGLFGLATLVESVRQNPTIPIQEISIPKVDRMDTVKSVGSGSFFGSIVGFLPGLSAGVATVVAMVFRKDPKKEQVIVTLSSINTANAFFVLVALFLILRPRSGAAIAIDQLIAVQRWDGILLPQGLAYLLFSALLAGTIAFFLTIGIGKVFARTFTKFPYRTLVLIIIATIISMVFAFTGPMGLFILAISTSIGMIPPAIGIRRSHGMAVLLVPVIVWLW